MPFRAALGHAEGRRNAAADFVASATTNLNARFDSHQ